MAITLRREKPSIPLFDFAYSPNPAKNYIYQVLAADILSVRPQRSLDGGFGELRNLWMFPGQYVGIGLNHAAYFRGLKRYAHKQPGVPAVRSFLTPEVYLMRLQSDFSFLDAVDLSVSTNTLEYVAEKDIALKGLISRVKSGGTLIVEDRCEFLDTYIKILGENFARVEIQYWGFEGCHFTDAETELDVVLSLSRLEMSTPNVREGHERFYLFATEKLSEPGSKSPRPEIIFDRGSYIVMKDLAYLRSDDEPLETALRRRDLIRG